MRYLVINEAGYGIGDTVREAIDAYRVAVRPGCWIDRWRVGIAPDGDSWEPVMDGWLTTKSGERHVTFDLDLTDLL